jgi:quercetin dioxygenase-like cupin family protein
MQPSVREDIMHPMFVKLFMETDDDDLLYEQGRRRRARRSRRARPAMAVRPAARDRQSLPLRQPGRNLAMTESIVPVTGSVISSPDAQAAIWFLGALSQVRVSGEQTGGAFALADHLARRGNASPVHVHDRDDETFFVLDGELRVFADEEEHTAGPGTVAVLPRRLRHAYVVTSATARFLTLHTPAGFERFAAEVGEPAWAFTLPPPPAGPPDFAALAQAAARHHIAILAPPPQL